jgi:Glycosyl transferase family 90
MFRCFSAYACRSSLSEQVEPAYVDYFFSSLIPWRHYIPVKNDLSDLLETVAFALDPANDGLIQEIITSANHWCAERSTHKGLVYDMLDTWESYIQMLDRGDPQWQQKWDRRKQALLAPTSNITLVRVK